MFSVKVGTSNFLMSPNQARYATSFDMPDAHVACVTYLEINYTDDLYVYHIYKRSSLGLHFIRPMLSCDNSGIIWNWSAFVSFGHLIDNYRASVALSFFSNLKTLQLLATFRSFIMMKIVVSFWAKSLQADIVNIQRNIRHVYGLRFRTHVITVALNDILRS